MWTIKELDFRKSDGIVMNVVAVYKSMEIIISLPEPEGDIIPYEDLTQEMVMSWIKPTTDILEVKIDAETVESEFGQGTPW